MKGEDPFKFPYRIWPKYYKHPNSLQTAYDNNKFQYPKLQINGTQIKNPIQYLDLFLTDLEPYQKKGYDYIVSQLKLNNPDIFNSKNSGIQYTITDGPLQALNILYPHKDLEDVDITSKKIHFINSYMVKKD